MKLTNVPPSQQRLRRIGRKSKTKRGTKSEVRIFSERLWAYLRETSTTADFHHEVTHVEGMVVKFCESFGISYGERTCVHCGCTDSRACDGGCEWSIEHRSTPTGVCSYCLPREIRIVAKLTPEAQPLAGR